MKEDYSEWDGVLFDYCEGNLRPEEVAIVEETIKDNVEAQNALTYWKSSYVKEPAMVFDKKELLYQPTGIIGFLQSLQGKLISASILLVLLGSIGYFWPSNMEDGSVDPLVKRKVLKKKITLENIKSLPIKIEQSVSVSQQGTIDVSNNQNDRVSNNKVAVIPLASSDEVISQISAPLDVENVAEISILEQQESESMSDSDETYTPDTSVTSNSEIEQKSLNRVKKELSKKQMRVNARLVRKMKREAEKDRREKRGPVTWKDIKRTWGKVPSVVPMD